MMNRREALQLTAVALGGTIIGAELFLSGCSGRNQSVTLFSAEDVQLMDEIGETILPESDRSPGAKAAHIGEFMRAMVTDCYDEQERKDFMDGLLIIRKQAEKEYGMSFNKLPMDDRLKLLSMYDQQAQKNDKHFFGMMKQLTIWGYFTSEPGATQALRYNPVPGRFEGCIPYQTGDKAWA